MKQLKRLSAVLSMGVAAWLAGFGTYRALDAAYPLSMPALDASPQVFARDGTPMRVGLTTRGERLIPTPLAAISPHLVHALLVQEDRRFFEHTGIDLRGMLRAAASNLGAGGGHRQGASTITMQLARMLDPSRDGMARTVPGKCVQVFRALQIEAAHDKDTILERYLNVAPFGGNLRGVAATAHAWFGKTPRELTAAEAALMVSVLPAPSRLRPARDETAALRRRNRLLRAMGEEAACRAPLGLRPKSFPDLAPRAWERTGAGTTSIDPAQQAIVESVARRAAGPVGIVLVDNETRAVRGLVGGDYARSAGSTLKPFLYALAFDAGFAAPRTRLLDLAWTARNWAPRNFDRVARGPVPAAEALAESYNLPAIRLAARLPQNRFAARLQRAGFTRIRATGPAIDLAIGTDDVTAMQLAGAYAALANGGIYQRPWLRRPGATRARVCSEGAAALVTAALARGGAIAFKTGTSSGRRDAWAAGYTTRYTAVVWRGRIDGKSDSALVGARAAAPLLLDLLGALEPLPFAPATGVRRVRTCAESGLAANADCPAAADSVPEDAALAVCTIHRRLPFADGHVQCPHCRTGGDRAFRIYAPSLAAWRRRAGLATPPLPPHDPACRDPIEPDATRPVLLSPREGQVVSGRVIVRALGGERLTLLLDGVVAAVARPGAATSLDVAPGPHALTVLTERARARTVRFSAAD